MDFIDYDDFYNEPSDSDIAIEELKEHLRNEVKSEILSKLKRLEKENKELQEVRKNWLNIKRELESKIASVELEKEAILRNARREIYDATLQDLFDNCPNVEVWGLENTDSRYAGRGTFYNCISLTGKAPELWNRDNVKDNFFCFYNCTNLENYDDIPDDWK